MLVQVATMSHLLASLVGLFVLQASTTPDAPAARTVTPNAFELRDRIAREGASAVMQSLFDIEHNQSGPWSAVIDKIAGGKREWLEIAQLLLPAADGIYAEDLYAALSLALPKAPEGVLAATGEIYLVCANGMTVGDTFNDAVETIRKRRLAMSQVRALRLKSKRQQCLDAITELEDLVHRDRKTWFKKSP